jgi:hypothetical protein
VEGDGSVLVTFRLLVRDATYRNSFGFVRVDAPDGRIAELRPGMPAYVTAALRRATPVFDADLLGSGPVIGPEGNMETSAQLTLPAGSHIVLFLVQDGDLAAARDASASASADERPAVFFSVGRANPDGMHHLVILEQSGTELRRFGFEDLTGGGDEDFNDAVFEVDPGLGFADARN